MFLYMDGTHAVVLLDLKCVFELLHIGTALRTPPLQGHPGHSCPDKPWCQRQSRQGAHGDIHHLWTEATAEKEISILSFPSKRWRNDCHGFQFQLRWRHEYFSKWEKSVKMKRTLTEVLWWLITEVRGVVSEDVKWVPKRMLNGEKRSA